MPFFLNPEDLVEKIPSRPTTLRFTYPTSTVKDGWLTRLWVCQDPNKFSTCSGLLTNIIQYIGDALNMTVSVQVPTGNNQGRQLANGSWTGSIKDIVEGRADLILVNWDPSRCQAMECMGLISDTQFASILIPQPQKKPFYSAFTEPYSPMVWFFILISLVATGLMLQFLKKPHFKTFTWFGIMASLLNQDPNGAKRGQLGSQTRYWYRFFPWGTWLVVNTILSGVYGALVIQFFMDPFEKKITNLEGLLDTDLDLKISPFENVLIQYIQSSGDPTLVQLKGKIQEITFQEYYNFYPDQHQAYIDSDLLISHRVKGLGHTKKAAMFYKMVETKTLPKFHKTLAFSKKFLHLEKVRKKCAALVEFGISLYQFGSVGDKAEKVTRNGREKGVGSVEMSISLENFRGALIVYGLGLFGAVFVFFGEVFCGKRRACCCNGGNDGQQSTNDTDEA